LISFEYHSNSYLKILSLLNKKVYAIINNKTGTSINVSVIISLMLEYLTETSEKIIESVPIKNKIILKVL
tara:strand:+ start:319 stop:528 length:210 start_codon:yes stop_codon:yes gene_type:complete